MNKQEPVAWRVKDFADGWIIYQNEGVAKAAAKGMDARLEPLYTSPPPITEGEPSDAEVWKPIETAPKDGSRFLALEGDRHFDCWFVSDQYEGCFWQDEADSEPAPTHWMPLPSAPLLAAKSKGGQADG